MELISLLIIVILLLVLYKLWVYQQRVNRLKCLPGPPPLPILGNILDYTSVPRHKVLEFFLHRHLKYGNIFVTWFGSQAVVHTSHPRYSEMLLNNTKLLRKGYIYKFLLPWLGTGLLTSEGRKWFTHRKMITPTFHFKVLESFLDIFNDTADVLLSILDKCSDHEEFFDIYPFITRCALDIICETAMGTKINAQSDHESRFAKATYKICELIFKRQITYWQHADYLYYWSPPGRQFNETLHVLHDFTERVIRERKLRWQKKSVEDENDISTLGCKKREAFLDLLLDASESQSLNLTDTEIREEVDTFMFEGHDTTTAGMSWALFMLGCHPDIQNSVRAELTEIFKDDPLRKPTLRDLNEMKYLERVIKETLRLYPSVPIISRTLEQDLQLDKYIIPKNTAVLINIYAMQRNPEVFPNPEKFDPNRFLPENSHQRHPYAFIPFSAGPRNCIGQKFALLEEKVVLSSILRKFHVETKHKIEEVIAINELIVRPYDGIYVRLTKI